MENLGLTLNAPKKGRVVRKALTKFNAVKRDSNSNEFRINYNEERREYKPLKQKRAAKKTSLKRLKKMRRILESSGVRSNPQ